MRGIVRPLVCSPKLVVALGGGPTIVHQRNVKWHSNRMEYDVASVFDCKL